MNRTGLFNWKTKPLNPNYLSIIFTKKITTYAKQKKFHVFITQDCRSEPSDYEQSSIEENLKKKKKTNVAGFYKPTISSHNCNENLACYLTLNFIDGFLIFGGLAEPFSYLTGRADWSSLNVPKQPKPSSPPLHNGAKPEFRSNAISQYQTA